MIKIRFIIIIWAMCIVNMLLPIERGFPLINIFGITNIPIPVILNFAILIIIACENKIYFLKLINDSFFKLILLCSMFFALTSIQSPYPKQSFSRAILFFSTFGLNWLIFRFLSIIGYRKWIMRAICIIGILAAIIIIAEGYFKYKLSFYASFEKEKLEYNGELVTERSWGTLGNPILSGILLISIIPISLEVRPKWIGIVLSLLYVAAAATTYSRTILLMIFVLAIGIMIIAKNNYRLIKTILFISGALAMILIFFARDNQQLIDIWTNRVKGTESEAKYGIESRIKSINRIINEYFDLDKTNVLEMMVGHGWNWENDTAYRIAGTDTIDNAYLALLYYYGLIGLVLFIMPFFLILVRNRKEAKRSLHWYNIIALLSTGVCYTFFYYTTTNYVAVSSIAVIGLSFYENEYHSYRSRRSFKTRLSSSPIQRIEGIPKNWTVNYKD